MKGARLFVPATLVALSLTSAVIAQDRGRGFRGFRGLGFNRPVGELTLIASRQVREELGVTEEQKSKVDEVLASYREKRRELFRSLNFRELPREEREEKFEEFRKKSAEIREKTEKKLANVLEEDQKKRLEEIALQQEGIDALVSEQVVAALKLDEEQMKKIRQALESRDEEVREVFSSFRPRRGERGERGERPDFGELREKAEKARDEAKKTVLAVLSEEQREKFEELKGEPFELDRRSLRRGRRGGDFGGGRGRRGDREERERRRPPLEDEDEGTEI